MTAAVVEIEDGIFLQLIGVPSKSFTVKPVWLDLRLRTAAVAAALSQQHVLIFPPDSLPQHHLFFAYAVIDSC
jgi:hypothetical protein